MPEQQARVRPSGLALTIACNASLQLQEQIPPIPDSDEEAEGHAGHWVARRYAAGFAVELPIGAKFHAANREWKVTEDMHAGALLWCRAMGAPHPELYIEHWVKIRRVNHEHCAGTPDGFRYFPDARLAYSVCPPGLPVDLFNAGLLKLVRTGDYKFGRRYVEAFENPQPSSYCAGVIDLFGLSEVDPYLYVEIVIVQPRNYSKEGHVRYWRTHATSLRVVLNDCYEAADRALMPLGEFMAPKASAGRHCIDCKARHVCETLQKSTMRLADYADAAETVNLSPEALGRELSIVEDALKQLEARQTGLSAQAESMIRAGKSVAFYMFDSEPGKLTYFENANTDELISAGDLFGIDVRRKLERKDLVCTPTQAIQRGVDLEVMKAYAHRPRGALKLTRINPTKVRKVFAT